jgi:3D (Asp-Asp-Asp) domain-containing protein
VLQYDEQLAPGVRERTRQGVPGTLERVVRVAFEDEVEIGRSVLGQQVVRVPVDELIAIGPAIRQAVPLARVEVAPPVAPSTATAAPAAPPPAPPVPLASPAPAAGPPNGNVRRVVTMVSTAYDPGPASTGKSPGHPAYGITASGMRAGYGVVAVDPRVIPLRTRLYVPGYGYAIAGDTGGAIKGNRIDLGFATYAEAIRWGRRPVEVYILD